MRIHIDINHPAHVHYFKNFIKIMSNNGHTFIVTNRDSPIIIQLLKANSIKHITRNKRPNNNSKINSLIYLFSMIFFVFKYTMNKKVGLYLGFASSQNAIVAFLRRKPSIIIDDTEHNKLNHAIYTKFCSVILTPFYFTKNLGRKQIHFNAYVEQLYLHSNFYKQNQVNETEPYAICRFIAYDAAHDKNIKNKALTILEKKKIVETLEKKFKVYVSLESEYDEEKAFFEKRKFKINPEEIHDYISHSDLFITEGATMASEAGILGVNYYYINPLNVSNLETQCENYENGNILSGHELLAQLDIIINKENLNKEKIKQEIEDSTICPTSFLVWFVENYPESEKVMQQNFDYQLRFK